MKKYVGVLVLTASLVLAGVAGAITIENPSFELPGVLKPNIADVPGWHAGDVNLYSGAETGWNPTDGDYTGYMQIGAQIYNLTDHVVAAGMSYTLTFDMQRTWWDPSVSPDTPVTASLFYDDNGTRVPMESLEITFPNVDDSGMAEYALSVNSNDIPDAIGKQIGIQITGGTLDEYQSAWIGYDNFQLIPEPTTIALLGLGAIGMIRRRRA